MKDVQEGNLSILLSEDKEDLKQIALQVTLK